MNAAIHPTLGYRDAHAAIDFSSTPSVFEMAAVYDGKSAGAVAQAVLRWPGGGIVTLYSKEPDGIAISDLAPIATRAPTCRSPSSSKPTIPTSSTIG